MNEDGQKWTRKVGELISSPPDYQSVSGAGTGQRGIQNYWIPSAINLTFGISLSNYLVQSMKTGMNLKTDSDLTHSSNLSAVPTSPLHLMYFIYNLLSNPREQRLQPYFDFVVFKIQFSISHIHPLAGRKHLGYSNYFSQLI